MGKYKRLLSNTAILGAGTFASKVLVLLLMPFYTSILSTAEFGTADLIAQTANLLIPLAAVGICDGIFRFTLDSEENKASILSTGVTILLGGSALLCLFAPLVGLWERLSGSVVLIVLYVIAANLHSAFAGYIRALGKTTMFAVQGIINTVLTILLKAGLGSTVMTRSKEPMSSVTTVTPCLYFLWTILRRNMWICPRNTLIS